MTEQEELLQRLEAIVPKQDSPERLAFYQQFGRQYYADAEYLNVLIEAALYTLRYGGGGIPDEEVFEFTNLAAFPAVGEPKTIYIDKSTDRTYRWTGTAYIAIGGISDISGKLNTGANTGLSGSGIRIPKVSADGTITVDDFFSWLSATRELVIGNSTTTGRMTIYSNIHRDKVLTTIPSGYAWTEVNDNQADAYSYRSANGKKFTGIRSTTGDEASLIFQKQIKDLGLQLSATSIQASIVTTATVAQKVYGKYDTLGVNDLVISLPIAGQSVVVWGMFKCQNSGGTAVIACKFKAVAVRVGSTVTVYPTAPEILRDNGTSGFSIGLEASGTTVKLFFQKGASDANVYTGGFLDINYSI